MSGKNLVKFTSVLLLALWFSCGGIKAVSIPSGGGAPTNTPLDSWSFYDQTNWTSDQGDAPLSFTKTSVFPVLATWTRTHSWWTPICRHGCDLMSREQI